MSSRSRGTTPKEALGGGSDQEVRGTVLMKSVRWSTDRHPLGGWGEGPSVWTNQGEVRLDRFYRIKKSLKNGIFAGPQGAPLKNGFSLYNCR